MSGLLSDRDRDRIRRGLVNSQDPPRRDRFPVPSSNLQWVKLDSTTPDSGRYDGQIFRWDAAAQAFEGTGLGDVWVEFANGITPDTSIYYHAQCVGFENGRPVFLVDDFATAGGGGTITVQDIDGSPSVANVTTLRFDQADGFTITTPGAGIARVDFTPTLLTVQDIDGTPSVASVTTLRFDEADGFAISTPGAGIARVDITPRITVRKNTGVDVGTRPRLNFIEGTNVTITVADDVGSNEIDLTFAVPNPTITVREVDASPSVASVTTLEFDQGDGFVVSNPFANVARVDFPFGGLTLATPDLSADSFAIHDDSANANRRVLLNRLNFPHLAECRLSLSSTNPVDANVSSSGSVYLHRWGGSWIALREDHATAEGSGIWIPRRIPASAISASLSGLMSGGDGFIYAYWNGSTVVLEVAFDGTAEIEGVKVMSSDRTKRYVGYACCNDGANTCSDDVDRRLLYSWYNPIRKAIRAGNDTQHTYDGGGGVRRWNDTDVKIEICSGPSGDGMRDSIWADCVADVQAGALGNVALATMGFNSSVAGSLSIDAKNHTTGRLCVSASRSWNTHEFQTIRETIWLLENGAGSGGTISTFYEGVIEGHVVS